MSATRIERGFAAIGLYNPKTNENVGSVLRASMCYDASLVVIQGQRYTKARTDTTTAWRHIPLQQAAHLLDATPFGAVPVAVEFIKTSCPLPRFTHPESAFYLFGPEDGSLPKAVVERCKHVVYIPTTTCLNLAMTVNTVLYDRLVKRSAQAAAADPMRFRSAA